MVGIKPDSVNFAKPEDAPEVYQLMLDLWEDNGVFTIDPVKSRMMCASYFDPKTGIVGIIRGPTEIEGAIAMRRAQPDYSNDEYLSESYIFVRPAYRKSTHAHKLLDFGKYCSTELGIPLIVGINSLKRVNAKRRFYERNLTPFGAYYIFGRTPRFYDEIEQYAQEETKEEKETAHLLAEYKKAVEMFFDSKKPGRRAKDHSGRLTVDSAIERLRTVHAKAMGEVNGHAVASVASVTEERAGMDG